jgi:hypothetical protein
MRFREVQRLLIIVPVTAALLIVAYFWLKPASCDSIFEQTAPRLESKLEILKSQAKLVIGPEQVQALTDSSQKVGLHLKACCIFQMNGHMSAVALQSCIDGAKNYETRIAQVTDLVGQAQAAREQGKTQLENERVAQAKQATEAASDAARHLQEVVAGISAGDEPPPLDAKKTILPLAPPAISPLKSTILPLKPTILPLKATIVPAGRSPPG